METSKGAVSECDVVAPHAGIFTARVSEVHCAVGEEVVPGDVAFVIVYDSYWSELQLELTFTIAGTVSWVGVGVGQEVDDGQVLARVDAKGMLAKALSASSRID